MIDMGKIGISIYIVGDGSPVPSEFANTVRETRTLPCCSGCKQLCKIRFISLIQYKCVIKKHRRYLKRASVLYS